MSYQKILNQIEFSLSLLEPPALLVKAKKLSFKKGWFSGIWAKYQPKGYKESLAVFIPHNELKKPYFLRSAAEKLVKRAAFIKVYPLRIDTDKESRNPRKWQVLICTMFSSDDETKAITEAEESKSVTNGYEINIKEGIVIEGKDFKLEVVGVEYHENHKEDEDRKRSKTVVFRITAPSKYPILRLEQERDDFKKWENLSEHSDRKSSFTIRRFFYKKRGKNAIKVGNIKFTLIPFFSDPEQKEMQGKGYVGKVRITR